MIHDPYAILERKRLGETLQESEIQSIVDGTCSGDWSDAQLGAFLMAAAIHELNADETRRLTVAMLGSGEQWRLRDDVPLVGDKHSTGGVGDKVSLVLSPLLAACGQPVVMLTGRGLGHTAGTADKLECIPGVKLDFDRAECVRLLETVGVAIGVATGEIAPADKRIYQIRDKTATVDSLPLVTASILSKKLAVGPGAVVFDVKTGSGAFFPDEAVAGQLAELLVSTSEAMGCTCRALVTDMSQPLGDWVGHNSEIGETLDCLRGEGPSETMEVTYALSLELASMTGADLSRSDLEAAISSGRAWEKMMEWAAAQGAEPGWLESPALPLAPVEVVLEADRTGCITAVDTRRVGHLLALCGGGRSSADGQIDPGVAFRWSRRLGDAVEPGEELGRLYLRQDLPEMVAGFSACIELGDDADTPALIRRRIPG